MCLFLAAPLAAAAQIKCTMPNGVVSIFKLADKCPDGAVKSEKNGVIENIRPKPKEIYRQPTLPPIRTESKAPPSEAPKDALDILNEANGICAKLRLGGATTCEIDLNIFSASVIDVTLATNPTDALMTCLLVANQTRRPNSPFAGRGWQMKIFSPYGNSRPIAACSL